MSKLLFNDINGLKKLDVYDFFGKDAKYFCFIDGVIYPKNPCGQISTSFVVCTPNGEIKYEDTTCIAPDRENTLFTSYHLALNIAIKYVNDNLPNDKVLFLSNNKAVINQIYKSNKVDDTKPYSKLANENVSIFNHDNNCIKYISNEFNSFAISLSRGAIIPKYTRLGYNLYRQHEEEQAELIRKGIARYENMRNIKK